MPRPSLPARTQRRIDGCVQHFIDNREKFSTFAENLHNVFIKSQDLKPFLHSTKFRVKDESHLRRKLRIKAVEAQRKGRTLNITPANLFQKIGDLAGVRLLHLHTDQMAKIHPLILEILKEQQYKVIEKPEANTWDEEYRLFFKSLGIKTIQKDSLYTSVHYVIQQNSKTRVRCELQVRTLSEELWGEVSHTINYPTQTLSLACREQLKVLARTVSGCTRLVDSIFKCHREHVRRRG